MEGFSENRVNTYNYCPWFIDDIFNRWIVRNIRHLGSSICDIGAGTGNIIKFFLDHFEKILAVEKNEYMLEILRENYTCYDSVKIRKGNAENLPVEDKSYDICITKSALHHFSDRNKAISEMQRVGKKVIILIEVIAPDMCCIPFLKQIVLSKEKDRDPDTIFLEQDLINYILKYTENYRSILFDQYIIVDRWLQYSDLTEDEQKRILHQIRNQNNIIKNKMQIHSVDSELYMLRRMNMVIGII